MRIAQVAPLYESVPPARYGGTERIVSYLTEELVADGHEVTLFASGDSLTAARLEVCCPRALRLDRTAHDPLAYHLAMLDRVYQMADRFDVIHCHTDYLGLPLTGFVSVPTILTLHGRLDLSDAAGLYRAHPEVALVSISAAQRRPMPELAWAATVHHGLPLDLYAAGETPGRYLVMLGRISPEKDPCAAIEIAKRTGVPLRIAAKVDDVDREFFAAQVEPLLDHPTIEFLGEVDDTQKADLLRNALALLFPIDWPEPFGLVMIESLACGTPVIARRRGSTPEVIEDGVTGLICETNEEMAAAVGRVGTIERRRCRGEFERRFSARTMALAYVDLYRQVVATHRPPVRAPVIATATALSDRPPLHPE